MRSKNCDILVIGTGIAGLSFALHCAEHFPDRHIIILSKSSLEESNTRYAQGGIAAVMNRLEDSFEDHRDDTLLAGDGLCNKEVVEMVVKKAPAQMLQLMEWGVNFDHEDNQLELGREGGHRSNRILHCKDHTGASISSTLLQRVRQCKNIHLRKNEFVLELLTNNEKKCCGALIKTNRDIYQLNAHYTMLATGGAGQVYQLTSNPSIATGDGMALAKEIGAELENMAFVQFHPTVLYEPAALQPFLISEAVRGFGSILRNHEGEDFMHRYDERGSLATRDIVARAIFNEMQLCGKDHLWLDLRHLNSKEFAGKFPTIADHLQKLNIDICNEMVPILPAAHYFCGGIKTNIWGETNIPGLLACGECSCTGLHGANRLASNSLLEALVFARQAFEGITADFRETAFKPIRILPPDSTLSLNYQHFLLAQLQRIMTQQVGIIRSENDLLDARKFISKMLQAIPGNDYSITAKELKNLAVVALEIIDNSLQQTENRGGLYRKDLMQMPVL